MLSEDYAGAVAQTHAGLALLDRPRDPTPKPRCLMMASLVLIQVGGNLEQGLGAPSARSSCCGQLTTRSAWLGRS